MFCCCRVRLCNFMLLAAYTKRGGELAVGLKTHVNKRQTRYAESASNLVSCGKFSYRVSFC